tara:strand:+ start:1217 stop:1468 length:252 start_codon:yes stop_codon:yes gene_type:complete
MNLSNYYNSRQLAVVKSRIKSALLVEGSVRAIISEGSLKITNDAGDWLYVTTIFNYNAVGIKSKNKLNDVLAHLLIECKSEIY